MNSQPIIGAFVKTAALMALTSVMSTANQITVPIEQPSFESPVIAEGDIVNIATGWDGVGSSVYGVWHSSDTQLPGGPPDGQNLCYVFNAPEGSGARQVLSGPLAAFQPDADYTLTVKVADLDYGGAIDYDGYIVRLVVDGVVLAQDDNSKTPADGTYITSTVSYSYNAAAHSSLVGKPVEIHLLSKGLSGGYGEVDFDDVNLTYTTTSIQALPGGPYKVNGGIPLQLDGSSSQASPGATINSYLWDVDSDGQFDDASGAIPATTFSYTTLKAAPYNMVDGDNTISLKVTDTSGKTSISAATVTLVKSTIYTGPNANKGSDDWNKTTNWSSSEIPSGLVDVFIPDGKLPMCWNGTTPTYTGDLHLGVNSSLTLGWTTQILPTYNCLGTPGTSTIHLKEGSGISTRMGGAPIIPAIVLEGNASFTLGSSTQGGADAQFNHGITGPYQLRLYGNGTNKCFANFNTANTFSGIYGEGAAYVDGGLVIKGNTAGSLGTGNITIKTRSATDTNSYAILEINANDAMADSCVLSIAGTSATKIKMNANDTIAGLVIQDQQMAAGTYGSSSSSAANKVSWMTGTGVLTVTQSPSNYWDNNGTTAGAGGTSPSGTWDGSAKWTTSDAGTATTAGWIAGGAAAFSAGSDATGTYAITVGAPSGITLTNSKSGTANNNTSSVNFTETNWARNGGNAVVVLFSAINATSFTATYAGLPMTVTGVSARRNTYSGVAYIISDSLPSSGNIVINAPYTPGSNTGTYANFGYTYTLLSLSGVAAAGTPASMAYPVTNPPISTSVTYATTTSNAFAVGVACNDMWQDAPVTITGQTGQNVYQAHTANYNTILGYGLIPKPATYTDIFGGNSPTAMIVLPFTAKSTSNPLLSGQEISGLRFDDGTVTLSGQELKMQGKIPVTTSAGRTATISSQLTGPSGAGLTKLGAGTLLLGATSNNYNGATEVLEGTLKSNANQVLPDNSAVYIGGRSAGTTATLDLNNKLETIPSLELGGATPTSSAAVTTGTGTLTLGGNVVYNSNNQPLGASIAGKLALGSSTRTFNVGNSPQADSDLTVSAVISGTGGLTKTGIGTLLLSGNNSYSGETNVNGGMLTLSGNNASANGGIKVNNGQIQFNSAASINGTSRNVTVNPGAVASFGPSFGSANIANALQTRIVASSGGVIAIDNYTSTNFDLGAAGLSNAYLGAINNLTYSGSIVASGGSYRLGGGNGTITISGTNALSGSNNLLIGGSLIITGTNNMSGTSTINPGSKLQFGSGGTTGAIPNSAIVNNGVLTFKRSNTCSQGTDFGSPISGSGYIELLGNGEVAMNQSNTYSGGTTLSSGTLSIGHGNGIGTGPLTVLYGTLKAPVGTLTGNNPIKIIGNMAIGGSNNPNFGTGTCTIQGNRTLTIDGAGRSATFGSGFINNSFADQRLTVNGPGNTLVLGGYTLSTSITSYRVTIDGTADVHINDTVEDGGDIDGDAVNCWLIKEGSGTLTLSGNNTYGTVNGRTVVNSGVLELPSGTQESSFVVNDGGTIGFTLDSTIVTTGGLTLNPGHLVRITGAPTLPTYTLMSGSFILAGAPELETPIDGYELRVDGSDLVLTSTGDITPPTLSPVDIVDDQNGGPIGAGTKVTYNLTFNEDMDANSFEDTDFVNAGDCSITIGNITEVTPGVFTVEVTPTTAGTLQLRIPTTATLTDEAGNLLDSDPAIDDDTTITVFSYDSWGGGEPFDGDANGDGIDNGIAWLLGAADPNADARGLLPTLDADSSDDVVIIYYRRSDSAVAAGAQDVIRYTTTMSSWVEATAGPTITITTYDDYFEAGVDMVELRISKSLAPNGKFFMKLDVTLPPP